MGDRSRRRRFLASACALAALGVSVLAAPRAAADPTAATDDRSVTVETHEWVDAKVSPTTLQSDLSARGARLTRLVAVVGSSPQTFTATMVKNSGAYRVSTWWWYHDVTAAQLQSELTTNNGRLIYADAYDTASGEMFAAVMVQNSGADQRSWWWYHDVNDSTTIPNALTADHARLDEVKSYLLAGNEYQLAIMVKQTGIDAKSWTWGLETDPSTIQGYLDSFHYRLISLEHNPFGNFDYVMVQSEGETWTWSTGQTLAQVNASLHSLHDRLIDLTPYASGNTTLYGAVMVDDTDAQTPAINAETARVAGLLATGLKKSSYGVYLKQVGGSEVLGLDESFRYEPASAIKVLYLLYAMRQVQAGQDALGSDFVYYPDPSDPNNPGVCPDPAWETPGNAVHITLGQALTGMMQVSDNRFTRGMALRYGITNVDGYAHTIGMASTHLRQDRIGCLFVNGVRNETTGVDIGSLYEQVADGSLLAPSNASTFFGFMLGGAVAASSPLGNVVAQEAAKAGKSADVSGFIAGMSYHEKAGNEFMCVSSSCGSNAQFLDFTGVAGVMTLPFKANGTTVPTSFVYDRYGTDFVLPCVPGSDACTADHAAQDAIQTGASSQSTLGVNGAETFRAEVAAALATW